MTTTTLEPRASSPDSDDQPPKPHVSILRKLIGRHPIGAVLIAPYVLFIVCLSLYPIIFSLWISFHKYRFTAPGVSVPEPFVGFQNYWHALTDPQVQRSFKNVIIFMVINVPLTVILALVIAWILNQALPLRAFFRSAFYIPYVTASVAVITVWIFLFGADGLINHILGPLAPDPSWLSNSYLAMPVIAFFVAWKQLGFFIMLYLGALQVIPKERYEAASLDGASKLKTFWYIVVPGVRPATLLVVVLATITGANLFTEPYLLTGRGGPDGASASPVLIMYQLGIEQNRPDIASALGVILIIFVVTIVMIQKRFLDRD